MRLNFEALARPVHNRIDCLTQTRAYEFGFDKRSSRDSVHQAVFAAEMTNTRPFIVVIDTDGVEGKFEYEMRIVAETLGIGYARCHEDLIARWAITARWRQAGLDKTLDDLPRAAGYGQSCALE